jgi:hypothetical protein
MAPTGVDFFFGGSSVLIPPVAVTEATAPLAEVTGVIVPARVVSLVVSLLVSLLVLGLGDEVDGLVVAEVNGT